MEKVDLCILGGGINGAGIAADAAGRGLSVVLLDQADFAGQTSSVTSRYFHGGLRFLENLDFDLAARALHERTILTRRADYLARPIEVLIPQPPGARPQWLLRLGTFLMDRLGGKNLGRSRSVRLPLPETAHLLAPEFTKAQAFMDVTVHDTRLVMANLLLAETFGASLYNYAENIAAQRNGACWEVSFQHRNLEKRFLARSLVNATGPQVPRVLDSLGISQTRCEVRYFHGSHIILPCEQEISTGFLLQNSDKRLLTVTPLNPHLLMIGTTNVPVDDGSRNDVTPEEIAYLLQAANRFFQQEWQEKDIVACNGGLRVQYDPLASPQSCRDVLLDIDAAPGKPPLVSIYGGRMSIYRSTAQQAIALLAPYLPDHRENWTEQAPLPGHVNLPMSDYLDDLLTETGRLIPENLLQRWINYYGKRTEKLLTLYRQKGETLGLRWGPLTQVEAEFLVQQEYAVKADDILFRRTDYHLTMTSAEIEAFRHWFDAFTLQQNP